METSIRELDQEPGPRQALALVEPVQSLPDTSLNESRRAVSLPLEGDT